MERKKKKKEAGFSSQRARSRSDAWVSARASGVRQRPVTQAGCVKSTQSAQVSVGHAKRVQHTSIHADNHAHI